MLKILYATMTGSAETAAREMSAELKSAGIEHKLSNAKLATRDTLVAGDFVIICTSTYGDGMVPDPAVPFYEMLRTERPSLADIRYAVFGLGDRKNHGATFNYGGKRFDEVFAELGALRVRERYQHDSTSGAYVDDAAIEWIGDLLPELGDA